MRGHVGPGLTCRLRACAQAFMSLYAIHPACCRRAVVVETAPEQGTTRLVGTERSLRAVTLVSSGHSVTRITADALALDHSTVRVQLHASSRPMFIFLYHRKSSGSAHPCRAFSKHTAPTNGNTFEGGVEISLLICMVSQVFSRLYIVGAQQRHMYMYPLLWLKA